MCLATACLKRITKTDLQDKDVWVYDPSQDWEESLHVLKEKTLSLYTRLVVHGFGVEFMPSLTNGAMLKCYFKKLLKIS